MFFRKLATSLAFLGGLSLLWTACGGASFDDPAVIKGLRVIAVQKSSPYPKPGETVNLKLLFWDGKSTEDNPRDLNIQMFTGPSQVCVNPPGDLYFNCFAPRDGGIDDDIPDGGDDGGAPDGGTPDGDIPEAGTSNARRVASAPSAVTSSGATPGSASSTVGFTRLTSGGFNFKDFALAETVEATRVVAPSGSHDVDHIREATLRIPRGTVDGHQTPPGFTEEQRYGLVYVLFVACAGTPRPVLNAGPNQLPFGCFDAEGRQLGSDDFVIGYTSMYVYNNRPNNNPVIDGLSFVTPSGTASLDDSIADEAAAPHIPSCKGDRTKCTKYTLAPLINKDLTDEEDLDPTAVSPSGKRLHEQVWVTYYLTAGEFKSSVRLVNDATQGWNYKNEAEFTAPGEPGPVRFFAVVHDNRGGVAWVEGKIIVD